MTTVVVCADPPRPGLVLSGLPKNAPLSPPEAADLYAAMLQDVVRAVERSGGDLLVNYRSEEDLPDEHPRSEKEAEDRPDEHRRSEKEAEDHSDEHRRSRAEGDGSTAETAVGSVVRSALEEPEEARLEVQVGETFAGRVGNTVTHLLENEAVGSVAVVEPTAAFLGRTHIDGTAMTLRRSEVVLGPAPAGRVYLAGFTDTIDFRDAYAPPAVTTLATRGRDAGHDVDFVETLPVVATADDFASALALLDARRTAGRPVPERFAATCDEFGVAAEGEGDGLRVVR